jgi:hypothetical protein
MGGGHAAAEAANPMIGGLHAAAAGGAFQAGGGHVAPAIANPMAGGPHAAAAEDGRKEAEVMALQTSHGTAVTSTPVMGAVPQGTTTTQAPTLTASTTPVAPEAPKITVPPNANASVVTSGVPESSHQGNQKSKGKPFCYRCHTKGHTLAVCTVSLCCEICYGDHVTKICPNMKKMNTTAIPCGYAVEGLGFYFIPVAENPKLNLEEKSAVVRVLEGSLTADQLAVELEKLLPGKNKWVIEEKGTGVFTTNFPSSELLEYMVNWGPMDTKTVKGKIRFEKGVENEVYKYEIDKVWVQFRGLPKEFREFPIIWAVGSILGVPRAVDTKFTNKFGRARMKVAVLDPNLIPDLVDVVIGDYVYELQFRVEQDMSNGEPQVIDMDSTMDEDKPNGEKRAIKWMRMEKRGGASR